MLYRVTGDIYTLSSVNSFIIDIEIRSVTKKKLPRYLILFSQFYSAFFLFCFPISHLIHQRRAKRQRTSSTGTGIHPEI